MRDFDKHMSIIENTLKGINSDDKVKDTVNILNLLDKLILRHNEIQKDNVSSIKFHRDDMEE